MRAFWLLNSRTLAAPIVAGVLAFGLFSGPGTFSSVMAAEAKAAEAKAEKEGGGHETTEAEGPITGDVDLALWTLITFVVFVTVLGKFGWGPLVAGLDKRETKVLENIAQAESARIKAEKMLAEHAQKLAMVQDEVREILAEARRDAEHTKNEIIATAQKEADANRQRAVHEIEQARDQALDQLFEYMAKSVDQATERVIGRALTGVDHDRLIEEALAGFSGRKH